MRPLLKTALVVLAPRTGGAASNSASAASDVQDAQGSRSGRSQSSCRRDIQRSKSKLDVEPDLAFSFGSRGPHLFTVAQVISKACPKANRA
jgi:hypothetical protein